jgi:hypothetical protein
MRAMAHGREAKLTPRPQPATLPYVYVNVNMVPPAPHVAPNPNAAESGQRVTYFGTAVVTGAATPDKPWCRLPGAGDPMAAKRPGDREARDNPMLASRCICLGTNARPSAPLHGR